MPKNLYFLVLVMQALQQPEPAKALKDAFGRIRRLGRLPEYQQGHAQFKRFMVLVFEAVGSGEELSPALVWRILEGLITQLADGTFRGDSTQEKVLREVIESRPEWHEEYDTLRRELQTCGPCEISLLLKSGDQLVTEFHFPSHGGRQSVGGIFPGFYSLLLDTGRVLWNRRLTESDLIWSLAFPGQRLALAADTGGGGEKPTVEERLLGGAVTFRVFAEIEDGRLEVQVNPFGCRGV